MQKHTTPILCIALTIAMSISVNAQNTTIASKQQLESLYAVTTTTFDRSDIVTAGAVLTLNKNNLVMVPVNSANLFQNTYAQGRITQNSIGTVKNNIDLARRACAIVRNCPPVPAGPVTRTFVAGEKMWVTRISVNDKNVVFELLTDPYDNVRYKARRSPSPTPPAMPRSL